MLHGHGHRAPEAILSHYWSETLQWDVLVLSSSGVMSSIFIRTTDSRRQQSGAEPSERSGAQRDERGACPTVVAMPPSVPLGPSWSVPSCLRLTYKDSLSFQIRPYPPGIPKLASHEQIRPWRYDP